MGGGDGWAAGGRLYLPIGVFGVAMSSKSPIVIGPDKPSGPKRHLTNAGVNTRHMRTSHLVPSMGLIV